MVCVGELQLLELLELLELQRPGLGVSLRCAPGRAARAVGHDTAVSNCVEPPAGFASSLSLCTNDETPADSPRRGLAPSGAHPSRNGSRRIRARRGQAASPEAPRRSLPPARMPAFSPRSGLRAVVAAAYADC